MISSLALLAALTLDGSAIARQASTLDALGPHPFGSPRNQAAAQFVSAKFQEVGLSQTRVEDFELDGATGTNVVATLQGRSDRLLIIATHHDSRKDTVDVSDRSRSLALLIEMARQVATLRPAKTWILASFDGGEAGGEGFAHYLENLGRSRGLVDGVVILDAAPRNAPSNGPSLIVPACPANVATGGRAIAGRNLVEAAMRGVPPALEFSFDDPGIHLLTQPFIRAFRTACDPLAARALAQGLGVVLAKEISYSRGFMAHAAPLAPEAQTDRDGAAARLGEVALGAIQGIDASTPPQPQSDSWLVVGRQVLPGWLLFLIGVATLIPGFVPVKADRKRLALRVVHAASFVGALYFEPEVSLLALALPNLLPPTLSRTLLAPALLPAALLIAAGGLGFARGQVIGTWVSVWVWLALATSLALVYAMLARGKKAPARARAKKKT